MDAMNVCGTLHQQRDLASQSACTNTSFSSSSLGIRDYRLAIDPVRQAFWISIQAPRITCEDDFFCAVYCWAVPDFHYTLVR
jgi:hypothetical protein